MSLPNMSKRTYFTNAWSTEKALTKSYGIIKYSSVVSTESHLPLYSSSDADGIICSVDIKLCYKFKGTKDSG